MPDLTLVALVALCALVGVAGMACAACWVLEWITLIREIRRDAHVFMAEQQKTLDAWARDRHAILAKVDAAMREVEREARRVRRG